MRTLKIALSVAGILFLLIQLIRPEKNQQEPTPDRLDSIPPAVATLLKNACYDCHSNQTVYPWYAHIQPAGWFLAHHIRDGKAALNFDTFRQYTMKKQRSKLKSMKTQLTTGQMPLSSYTWLHPAATLTTAQRSRMIHWIDSLLAVK
ncbi:heme-binding domain-containing protein [Chitinophaga nivalis]|uniref:Heme-binding domain-containing protein n=1 Tax=Chitinophaga nivalis TaxID=2991709 RepID=A0ABT3IQ60_9BACT|nr:heme-binding domain-containing protein [Chitinophaga nivalis]MCW3464202.1 heme-binding domain-containing protein [Chitinophaga nivalis]MCW3486108.1 heme-binding domain-containing protein [Chitinophaga nivalis]